MAPYYLLELALSSRKSPKCWSGRHLVDRPWRSSTVAVPFAPRATRQPPVQPRDRLGRDAQQHGSPYHEDPPNGGFGVFAGFYLAGQASNGTRFEVFERLSEHFRESGGASPGGRASMDQKTHSRNKASSATEASLSRLAQPRRASYVSTQDLSTGCGSAASYYRDADCLFEICGYFLEGVVNDE